MNGAVYQVYRLRRHDSFRGILRFIACCALLSTFFVECFAAESQEPEKQVYCGPRSVQRVMKHYGKEVDLMELIHEMQWTSEKEGSSFEELSQALERRGVFSKSVRLPELSAIEWKYPAIVQIDLQGRKHFVVWLPPDESHPAPRIWDGAQSAAVLNGGGFQLGPLLLTSPQEINDSQPVAQHTPGLLSSLGIALFGCVAFGLGCCLPVSAVPTSAKQSQAAS